MGPPPYMRSVVDRNVVMRRIPVFCTKPYPAIKARKGEGNIMNDSKREKKL